MKVGEWSIDPLSDAAITAVARAPLRHVPKDGFV